MRREDMTEDDWVDYCDDLYHELKNEGRLPWTTKTLPPVERRNVTTEQEEADD
jgi:hypothetical protein